MTPKFLSLFAVASLALVSTAAHAQSADQVVAAPRATAQQPLSISAAELTRNMSTRLKLNEGQYIKLYDVNKTRVNQMAQIERDFRDDPTARASKLTELNAQYEQACSSILTPSQLSQLHEDKTQPGTTPTGTGNGVG